MSFLSNLFELCPSGNQAVRSSQRVISGCKASVTMSPLSSRWCWSDSLACASNTQAVFKPWCQHCACSPYEVPFKKHGQMRNSMNLSQKCGSGFRAPQKRDYMSNLNRLRYASRREAAQKRSIHVSMWAFWADLTRPLIFIERDARSRLLWRGNTALDP